MNHKLLEYQDTTCIQKLQRSSQNSRETWKKLFNSCFLNLKPWKMSKGLIKNNWKTWLDCPSLKNLYNQNLKLLSLSKIMN